MRTYLTLLTLLVCSTVLAQPNFSALDDLLQKNSAVLSGNGGGWAAVIQQDGKTLYQGAYGNFNADKIVPIASASKWYAGTLVMCLVDEGKLSLDDKVSTFIPSFNTPEKQAITIGQCFALTSGLPGGEELLDKLMTGHRTQSYAAMVDAIARIPLVAVPGSQLNYGGLGMQVAGRVAEIVCGKSWNQLFKEKVAEPLGLSHTWYGGANLHMVPRIAGGVWSTASDYLKLLDMLAHNGRYQGKRILSEKAVATLLADHTQGASIGYSPFTKYKPDMHTTTDARYGIGNWVIKNESVDINASPGAFGFTPWLDRERGYYGVIAVKSSFARVMPVFCDVLQLVNKELKSKGL